MPSPLFSQGPIASLPPQGDGGGLFEHVQIFVLQLIWREPASTGSGSWVAANLCFIILNTVLQIRILRNWRQHLNDGVLAISVLFLLFLLRVLIVNHSVVHVYVHTHIHLPVFICIDTYVCVCAHVCTCVCLWRPEVIFTCPSSDVIHFTA